MGWTGPKWNRADVKANEAELSDIMAEAGAEYMGATDHPDSGSVSVTYRERDGMYVTFEVNGERNRWK